MSGSASRQSIRGTTCAWRSTTTMPSSATPTSVTRYTDTRPSPSTFARARTHSASRGSLLDAMKHARGRSPPGGGGAPVRQRAGRGPGRACDRARRQHRAQLVPDGDLDRRRAPGRHGPRTTPRAFAPADEERVYGAPGGLHGHRGFTPATRAQWRAWNLGASSDPSLGVSPGPRRGGGFLHQPARAWRRCRLGRRAGVRQPWRRRRLGRALLLDAFQHLRGLGRRRVGRGLMRRRRPAP